MSEGSNERKREGGQRDREMEARGREEGDNEAFDEDFLGSICGSLHE